MPTVPLEPPPADGLTLGLLELEEDVFRDSYELARETFDTQLRLWRTALSADALENLRRDISGDDVTIAGIFCPGLKSLSDADVNGVCRIARALGARSISIPLPLAPSVRFGGFADRHGLPLAFSSSSAVSLEACAAILRSTPGAYLIPDLSMGGPDEHGPPVPFVDDHIARVAYGRIPSDVGDDSPAGVRSLLEARRDHGWTFPVLVSVDADDDDAWFRAAATIAHGRVRPD
jgi:hypothetical protein